MRNLMLILVVGAALFAGRPVFAHHAISGEFDMAKPITLEGMVTRVDWENPHVWFYVDVRQADGSTVNWAFETRGPNVLSKHGWKRDSLKPGDKVVVHGYSARNGSHSGHGNEITLADGRKIFSGKNY